jgi:hypothetical protein
LKPVRLAEWRRLVFVCFDETAASFDLDPLGSAIDAYPLESMELVLSETNDRDFNWKVLLENYSENYHTPFVHPELDTSSSEDYPMIADGVVLYAWDRTAAAERFTCRRDQDHAAARRAGLGGVGNGSDGRSLRNRRLLDRLAEPDDERLPPARSWRCGWSRSVRRRLGSSADCSCGPTSTTTPASRSSPLTVLVHGQDVDICDRVQRSPQCRPRRRWCAGDRRGTRRLLRPRTPCGPGSDEHRLDSGEDTSVQPVQVLTGITSAGMRGVSQPTIVVVVDSHVGRR